jgi:hypothetical protein
MIVKGPIIQSTWEFTVNPFTAVIKLHIITGRVFVTLSYFYPSPIFLYNGGSYRVELLRVGS